MRSKKYTNEWVKKEYIKGRSSIDISKEAGCTDANILRILRLLKVKRRNRMWTEEENNFLIKESQTRIFNQIAKDLNRSYDSVRIHAIKLNVRSIYSPADETRRPEIRIRISSTLQGINPEKWNGFKETTNSLIRKSVPYQEWRKAVFERDGYKCVKCGKGGYLHADHIKRFALFPDLRLDVNNGQTLCRKHHIIKTKAERVLPNARLLGWKL